VPDSASLDLTTGMTLEAWVRPSQLGTKWRTVLFKAQASNLTYGLYANRNTGRPNAQIFNTQARNVNGTGPLSLTDWSHLAATYDGSVLRLYVNGVQVATQAATGAMAVSTGELWIGANPVWTGERFAGLIDDIRIYNRPLTQAEIQADMGAAVGQ
jgi:Concanavalin A-like lectin/glucanases superfamily